MAKTLVHSRRMKKLTIFSLLFLGACAPTPGPDKSFAGAILGAGWGAGAGAVIGHQVDTNGPGPGAAIGAGFGAASGFLTGVGLDMEEGTALREHRRLDALKVQVASNERNLAALEYQFDRGGRALEPVPSGFEVYFDPGKASLRSGSVSELERFSNAIKRDSAIREIQLQGHSDDTGDKDRNQRLSERRARSVQSFLAYHGISLDQLKILPFGATRPRTTNTTDAGRQLNRRVEIILVR